MSAESICVAQVLAANPGFHSLLVQFKSSQIPTQPVRMLYNGPSDPLSIMQGEMPKAGTWGLVVFPNGDIRNGIWIGSINGDWRDSIMGGTLGGQDCAVADDPKMAYITYNARWTGAWDYSGWDQETEQHKTAMQWPDSASLVIGVDAVVPTLYRQDVDEGQNRVQLEYTMEDRVAEPPDLPLEMQYTHGSSTMLAVDPQGNLFVLGSTGTDLLERALEGPAALDVEFGGTIFAIGPADPATIGESIPPTLDAISVEASGGIASTAGDMNMLGNLDPPASWTVKFAGALIQIDHEGNIIFNAAPGGSIIFNSTTFAAITTGAINIVSGGDTQTSIDGRNFVLHTHIGVQTGAGISGPVV